MVAKESTVMDIQAKLSSVFNNITSVIRGKDRAVELALVALLSGGHILLEDIPGMGKTMLGLAISKSIKCPFKRIQFTNDTIPADILGVMVFSRKDESFRFVPGPIFAGIVLADEINRTSPKAQSALLEAMAEKKVSIENKAFKLPEPFMVIATQNPIEHFGTFPLPESQLDRFLLRINMGYPDATAEKDILTRDLGPDKVRELKPVITGEDVIAARELARQVRFDDSLLDYLIAFVQKTREDPRMSLGVSPRGSLMLKQAAQSLALFKGRDYVLPDDIKDLALSVCSHRVSLSDKGSIRGTTRKTDTENILFEIINSIPVPV